MALKFYASIRLDIRRTEQIKQGEEVIGNHVKVKIVKNKVAPPFRVAEFDIMYGQGISREADLLDLGTKMGIVTKSGTWYTLGQEKLGQGREQAKEFLRAQHKVAKEIEDGIRKKITKQEKE